MNVIGSITTSKGASILYLPPIFIPASRVPLPSILARDFTVKFAGLDDISSTIVVSPCFAETVVLS